MARWSDNSQPPYLGPGPPGFPPTRWLVYVSGPYALPWLAQGYVVQWTPNGLRLREAVWVWEPNLIPLPQNAYLRGRLVGSYPADTPGALPLVGTSLRCCQAVSSSASGVSPTSASPGSASPSASPSPSAAAGVFSNCCPGVAIPETLYISFGASTPAGGPFDGQVFRADFSPVSLPGLGYGAGFSGGWYCDFAGPLSCGLGGTPTSDGLAWVCNGLIGDHTFSLCQTQFVGGVRTFLGGSAVGAASVNCSPFHGTLSYGGNANTCFFYTYPVDVTG